MLAKATAVLALAGSAAAFAPTVSPDLCDAVAMYWLSMIAEDPPVCDGIEN
jgi:hypothetical protein